MLFRTGHLPLPVGRRVDHQAVGGLTAPQALRFVRIHQNHHLTLLSKNA